MNKTIELAALNARLNFWIGRREHFANKDCPCENADVEARIAELEAQIAEVAK